MEPNIFVLHWLDSRFCIYRNNLWLKGWSVERGKGGIGIESMFMGYARWFKFDAIPTQITSKTTIYKNKPLIEANKLFTCVASKSTNLFRKKSSCIVHFCFIGLPGTSPLHIDLLLSIPSVRWIKHHLESNSLYLYIRQLRSLRPFMYSCHIVFCHILFLK